MFLPVAFCVRPASAQKLEATVLYRQNSDNSYAAVVPRADGSTPEGTVDCAADLANEACANASQPAAPGQPSLSVTGTTLSLLLPDGRVAVVNCLNKYSTKGTAINRRSCAMPLVERVEADLDGQRAKLKWFAGTDPRIPESETYKIVALLDRR
jgi:hypothetical protein